LNDSKCDGLSAEFCAIVKCYPFLWEQIFKFRKVFKYEYLKLPGLSFKTRVTKDYEIGSFVYVCLLLLQHSITWSKVAL
jgi:hypothetical protein